MRFWLCYHHAGGDKILAVVVKLVGVVWGVLRPLCPAPPLTAQRGPGESHIMLGGTPSRKRHCHY